MRTRSLHLELTADELDDDSLAERGDAKGKHYSRGRSARTPKRRSTRSASTKVPLGIAARRNRRWAW